MILSMTGYGKGQSQLSHGKLVAEIRSLNSRGFDIRCKLPHAYREKEMEFRQIINMRGRRGKFDLTLNQFGEQEDIYELDTRQFKTFYSQLEGLRNELGFKEGDITQAIMRIPNVVNAKEEKLSEENFRAAKKAIESALDQLMEFRREEGQATAKDLIQNATSIEECMEQITPYEEQRNAYVKEKLMNQLKERFSNEEIDKNRFEQEVLYYLEKLDISEEKARLKQHCTYFKEQILDTAEENGRKLNFISQEMGREINTLGAKAQNSEIQHIVVQMKEDLEKIKEQVANIL